MWNCTCSDSTMGRSPGVFSSINIFDLPGDEPSLVFTENDIGYSEVTNQKR